ncbi:protein sidekick-1-like [Ornithodoros turicata]
MMFCKLCLYLFLNLFVLSDVFMEASYHIIERLPSVIEGDIGSRLTLHCNVTSRQQIPRRIVWKKDGKILGPDLSWTLYEHRGVLVSHSLLESDAGNYTCCLDNQQLHVDKYSAQLVIKTPPARLSNVTVHPSTVVATVRWHVTKDGGYPISHFTLLYQATDYFGNTSEIHHHVHLPVHISPAARQFFVYHLQPATPYMFRMWATNKLGPGEATTVFASTSKPIDPTEVVQKMFSADEDFSSTAWMVAVSMVMGTILILSCLSCLLIYKEGHHDELSDDMEEESNVPHIIANPGFEVDLEESYLLDHPDLNDNNERAIRTNNNSVVRPSHI